MNPVEFLDESLFSPQAIHRWRFRDPSLRRFDFWYNTVAWQTCRLTDRRTCRLGNYSALALFFIKTHYYTRLDKPT